MNIGVSANANEYSHFGKRWGEKTYEKLAGFGFTHIDFSSLGDFSAPTMTLPEEDAKALVLYEKELAERSGMVLHQAHAPVIAQGDPYTDEQRTKLMEGIKRCIRLCGAADIRFLVVHPLMVNGWSDRGCEIANDTFEQNVTLLTELADLFYLLADLLTTSESHGVTRVEAHSEIRVVDPSYNLCDLVGM